MVAADDDASAAVNGTMDPWGDADHVGPEFDAVPGFDDDFSDLTLTISNGNDCTDSPNPTERSSSPQKPPFNFIPRFHSNGDDFHASSIGSSSPPRDPTFKQPAHNLLPAFPPLKDPLTDMMSSEEYISRLEAKLKRIKGGGGGSKAGRRGLSSAAKQMIDGLSTVKESHVLLSSDGGDAFSESSRMDVQPNLLMQRAFPERTPLTREELEWLVNHDHLQPLDDDNDNDDDVHVHNTSS